jgi:hypothetical protein
VCAERRPYDRRFDFIGVDQVPPQPIARSWILQSQEAEAEAEAGAGAGAEAGAGADSVFLGRHFCHFTKTLFRVAFVIFQDSSWFVARQSRPPGR